MAPMAHREMDMVIELLQQVMLLATWNDCPDMDRRDTMIREAAHHAIIALEQGQSKISRS